MNNKLQLIREKCIAANPEIMELKLGCKIVNKYRNKMPVSLFVCKNGNTYRTFHEVFGYEDSPSENFEILGRPIRLADVLLAISKV